MHIQSVLLSSLMTTIVAVAGHENTMRVRGSMSPEAIFGLQRRQSGYQPTLGHDCGSGNTCEEACGAGYEQCASSDGSLDCYLPAQQKCCPNQSGLACDNGYYCTEDSGGSTWCCPDGDSLAKCEAIYSVSGLVSLGPATTPTKSASVPAASHTSSLPTTTPAVGGAGGVPSPSSLPTPKTSPSRAGGNGTVATPTVPISPPISTAAAALYTMNPVKDLLPALALGVVGVMAL